MKPLRLVLLGTIGALCALPAYAYDGPYIFGGGIYEISDSARDSDHGQGLTLGVGFPLGDRAGETVELSFKTLGRDRDIDNDTDYQHAVFAHWVKSLLGEAFESGPYLLIGAGAVQEDVRGDDHVHFALDGGLGARFILNQAGWGVRLEGIAQAQSNDESVPEEDYLIDYQLRLLLQVPIGGMFGPARIEVPPAPECPVRVVDPVTGDSSCSVDSDRDGVDDAVDLCPGTPAGTAVDSSGCAIGGTVDGDGDGVVDAVDACPETPVGMVVDGAGCLVEQTVTLRGVQFETGSARLTSDARLALDEVARTLKNQRNLQIEITGHTDDQGNDAFNQLLSQQRAESVRQHLIGRGVDADRMTAVGLGETLPVAANDTEEGRDRNRRVEFKVKVQ